MAAVALVVIGIVLLAAAGVTAGARRSFVRRALATEGIVVRLNAGGSHPQIEFTTSSGEKVSYPQGGLIFGYRPGDRVRVLYNPTAAAGTACVDRFGALWFGPLVLLILGLFCVAGALASAV